MRYAILEVLPPENPGDNARVSVPYGDLSINSANDARKAWNYQLARHGGWMEIVKDCPEAIAKRIEELHTFAFKSRVTA
jgi:hypothetical protein